MNKKPLLWVIIGLVLIVWGILFLLDLRAFLLPSIVAVVGISIIVLSITHWHTLSLKRKKKARSPTQNVRYCIHCGANISLNAKFCPTCGKKQELVAEPLEETQIY